MTRWIAVVGVVLLIAWAMDRVLLRAEARGWVFYRRRKASPGTSAAAALTMQAMLQPGARHVLESTLASANRRTEDEDESGRLRGGRP